jgi:glycosyltransferase involved in cell wall biosynthesis
MQYSIVIPAHNEALNLEKFVSSFLKKPPHNLPLAEVLLVENGSTDATLDACKRLQHRFPQYIKVCTIERASYGEAIRHGILQSRGTHLSILECDCLSAEFVQQSVELFQTQKAQFIVASKRHPDAVDRRPWKRRLLTYLYNQLLWLLLRYPGTDTHGLKSMETSLGKQLCDLAVTTDEIFQTEIVLLAWRLGVKVDELPLSISESRPAPVRIAARVPKVLHTISELRRSLARFSDEAPTLRTTTVS